MSLALKFKFISTERWEPKQNERGQAEFKQNKKSYWPKGVKLLKLISRHKKTKKKKNNLKDTNMMLTILGLGWGKPMQT